MAAVILATAKALRKIELEKNWRAGGPQRSEREVSRSMPSLSLQLKLRVPSLD
jgi:hypothetical protein